jgi:hypothetical protein
LYIENNRVITNFNLFQELMMHLYWVTTDDHCEDWFIIASSEAEAANWFEQNEGYDKGDATAQRILDIPASIQLETMDDEYADGWPGWPSEDILITLGATFISHDSPRVVEISGRRFCEGLLEEIIRGFDDDKFESLGQGRPNGTNKASLLSRKPSKLDS